MSKFTKLDKISISVKSRKLLNSILEENPNLSEILNTAKNEQEANDSVKKWVESYLINRKIAFAYYKKEKSGREIFNQLSWQDIAAIRILDYIDNSGKKFKNLNLRGRMSETNPIKKLWQGVHGGKGGGKSDFFEDMLFLFRQFNGTLEKPKISNEQINLWMENFASGLDPKMIKLRRENKRRIINVFIAKFESGEISSKRYLLKDGLTNSEKFEQFLEWWKDYNFHLTFAIRSPDLLNEFLDYSIDPDTMDIMYEAEEAGIPFFVNPYYLSLLNVKTPEFAVGADLGVRHYVLYSKQLVEEYGHIVAWEKEDTVEAGKPNAAGWILPTNHNVHRRYPEVAILIPATRGRACGGLCSSCQRMYDFQRGNLNFNLEKLKPSKNWSQELDKIVKYWEEDSQLRDILITGGDALMSSNESLKEILDKILEMAQRKKKNNEDRPDGKKYAEILRIRLGTRLLAYLPQRVDDELVTILGDFRNEAKKIGIKQFVVQTHFEAPIEITPEAESAVVKLSKAGWIITNQHVYSAAASRRGHAAKLRNTLNKIGILPYYTFTVKGYKENSFNFATNARAVQEQMEEKAFGLVNDKINKEVNELLDSPENLSSNLKNLLKNNNLPFLATDRNVLNLPGVGKSLTYRVIGITRHGRRILEFEYDFTRSHSPIIDKSETVIIIESKSISEYLQQLESMGEDPKNYESIWGYSIGETEPRPTIYEYPDYDYNLTEKMTNI